MENPILNQYLSDLAAELGVPITDPRFPAELDSRDPLAHFRDKFCIPTVKELLEGREIPQDVDGSLDCCYFLGNSLGLAPKQAHHLMKEQMEKWAKRGALGHTEGVYPWLPIEDFVQEESARIVGAKPLEVMIMNTLTVNVHLGMVTFYRPTLTRHKILCEKGAFPSDHYAMESQIHWHGYDPKTSLICLPPREGEHIWRTEDIVKVIEEEGDSIALVHLSGVHYSTGYVFDMKTITEAAHKKGCYVSFDLAHAAGNIELHLHDWEVDVATWCTYKYLNGGPGCVGGFFIHEKHAYNFDLPRFTGWWSHRRETRFEMNNIMELQPGAAGFQMSNPPAFSMIPLIASLEIFKETSMAELCKKSRLLTGYLEMLLQQHLQETDTTTDTITDTNTGTITGTANGTANGTISGTDAGKGNDTDEFKGVKRRKTEGGPPFKIITSSNPAERGCQLSLLFNKPSEEVEQYIQMRGFQVDLRGPLMRVAPVPLYNKFTDVLRLYNVLCEAIDADTSTTVKKSYLKLL